MLKDKQMGNGRYACSVWQLHVGVAKRGSLEGWEVGLVSQAGVGWIKDWLECQGPGARVLDRATVESDVGFRKS